MSGLSQGGEECGEGSQEGTGASEFSITTEKQWQAIIGAFRG